MRKQYMDFVPARATRPTTARRTVKRTTKTTVRAKSAAGAPSKPVPKPAAKSVSKSAPRGATSKVVKAKAPKTTNAVSFSTEKKPKLGQVENLNTRFVRSDVPKRPLSRTAHFAADKTGVVALKAKKVGNQAVTPVKPVENLVEKSKSRGVYQPPKSPFITQSKVGKRPLSKNVYTKKAVVPTEVAQGPVTIISKPEKQAHAGMIVTIILTIILGAAAGTVAFLLLPK